MSFNSDGDYQALKSFGGWDAWEKNTASGNPSSNLKYGKKTLGWFLKPGDGGLFPLPKEHVSTKIYHSKKEAEQCQRIKLNFDAPYLDYKIEMNLPKLKKPFCKKVSNVKKTTTCKYASRKKPRFIALKNARKSKGDKND